LSDSTILRHLKSSKFPLPVCSNASRTLSIILCINTLPRRSSEGVIGQIHEDRRTRRVGP
jgi:hypothetical protein